MRNCEDSSALKLLCDKFLDGFLSNDIDVSSCLIEQNYLVVFENSPYDAEELFLADSKVATIFSHFKVESWLLLFPTYLRSFAFLVFILSLLFLKQILKISFDN